VKDRSRPVLVLTEPDGFPDDAMRRLKAAVEVHPGPFDRPGLLAAVKSADGMMIRLGHQVDRELLEEAECLKAIASATTGLDHIDLDACSARGIEVVSLKDERAFLETIPATAEHTLALILALARQIPAAHNHAVAGGWNRDAFPGILVRGLRLGLVGLGRLGRMVVDPARALGMEVRGHDPFVEGEDVTLLALPDLLAWADVVSLHVAYDASTRHLIGESELARMKPNAFLINTARGGVVDEAALVRSLQDGRIGGAALDVLDNEANLLAGKRSRLMELARKHPRLILTPHIGGMIPACREAAEAFVADKLLRELGETR